MASFADTTFENEVREILNGKLRGLVTSVADGTPQSAEAYREQVGEIRGIKTALQACDEARRRLAGELPKNDAETRRKMASGNTIKGVV